MAFLLNVSTPLGVSTYHDIGQQSYDDVALTVRFVVHSWRDEDHRRSNDPSDPPLKASAYQYPGWIETPQEGALDSGKAALYDYLVALPEWSGAEAV